MLISVLSFVTILGLCAPVIGLLVWIAPRYPKTGSRCGHVVIAFVLALMFTPTVGEVFRAYYVLPAAIVLLEGVGGHAPPERTLLVAALPLLISTVLIYGVLCWLRKRSTGESL